jgi:type I restriction enzyme S subunit
VQAVLGPFDLPASWAWVRFGDMAAFSAGRTPSRHEPSFWNEPDYPWASIADLPDGDLLRTTKESVSVKAKEQVFKSDPVPADTMIMSFKLTIGKIARLAMPAYHNEAIISIRPFVPEMDTFLFLVLPERARRGATKGAVKGATLNRKSLADLVVPVPPVAEQHRIVAKVEELMALCEQLRAAQKARDVRRGALRAASLHRLTVPNDDGDTVAGIRFFLNTSPRLITKPEHVADTRQSVLDMAVAGRLVPQDPEDEPASEILRRIHPDVELHQRERGDDAPAARRSGRSLPPGWNWVTIADVFSVGGGIQKQPKRTPVNNSFPYLGVSNVQRGRLDLKVVARFELFPGELDRLRLCVGDILVVEGNGSLNEIGRCARWNGEIADCVHQNHIIRCRPLCPDLERFALLYLNSPTGTATMQELAITSAGLYSLSVGKIQRIGMPLPPIQEQHRIVERVDELMAVCDQLEAALASTQSTQSRALDALLHDALNGSR